MQKEYDLPLTDEAYLVLENLDLKLVPLDEGRRLYQKAEDARKALASRIRFTTPDRISIRWAEHWLLLPMVFGTGRSGFMER